MDFWSTIVLAVTFLIIIIVVAGSKRDDYAYPPGPPARPFVGNLFHFSKLNAHLDFTAWAKTYGDLFSLKIFGRKLLVFNHPDLIREWFNSEDHMVGDHVIAGRPETFSGTYGDFGNKSTRTTPFGDTLRKQREVLIDYFGVNDAGFDRRIEDVTIEELRHIMDWIEQHKSEPQDLVKFLAPSIANLMTALLFGKRFHIEDDRLKAAVAMADADNEMKNFGIDQVMTSLPLLRKLPLSYGYMFDKFERANHRFVKFYVEEPKKSNKPGVSKGLLARILQKKANGEDWLEDDVIKAFLKDLFSSAINFNSGALVAFFLICLHQPEVIKKIQAEVQRIVGIAFPSSRHRANMPYTEAAILELLRYTSHTPLVYPHSTAKELKIKEYSVPPNTTVVPNWWAIHHNEELWEDPWDFRPERFLDSSGKTLPADHKNVKNMMAFGIGRRRCATEDFGMSCLFLYITAFAQRFEFKPEEGQTLPPHDPRGYTPGLTLTPPKYKVQIAVRR